MVVAFVREAEPINAICIAIRLWRTALERMLNIQMLIAVSNSAFLWDHGQLLEYSTWTVIRLVVVHITQS